MLYRPKLRYLTYKNIHRQLPKHHHNQKFVRIMITTKDTISYNKIFLIPLLCTFSQQSNKGKTLRKLLIINQINMPNYIIQQVV